MKLPDGEDTKGLDLDDLTDRRRQMILNGICPECQDNCDTDLLLRQGCCNDCDPRGPAGLETFTTNPNASDTNRSMFCS